MLSAIARDPRRKTGWLKARVQHERDQKRRYCCDSEMGGVLIETENRAVFNAIGPGCKQTAFVKDEELECTREDLAGTPHISELQTDDDVIAPFSMEELGMSGEAEALAETWYECNTTTVFGHGCDRQ
jgi:hypothetical protein